MKRIFLISILLQVLVIQHVDAKTVSGHISSMGSGAVSGAKVSAKDAPSIFTFSDSKGFYKIEIPEEITILVFSHNDFQTKEVEISQLNNINVVLIPKNHKKFSFGIGINFGKGTSEIFSTNTSVNQDTLYHFNLGSFSLEANLFYRHGKHFEVQAILGDDINFLSVEDSTGTKNIGALNRVIFSLPVNYHFNLSKSGNYSIYLGLGPQIQNFTFLKSTTVGLRLQTGISLNNYGLNTKMFFASDITSGVTNISDPYEFYFTYSSFKFGLILVF